MYIYIYENKSITKQSTTDSTMRKIISLGEPLLDFLNFDFKNYEDLRKKICAYFIDHDPLLDDDNIHFSPEKTALIRKAFPEIRNICFEYCSWNWRESLIFHLNDQYTSFYTVNRHNINENSHGIGSGEILDYLKLQNELIDIIEKVFNYEYENQKYKNLSPIHRMAFFNDSSFDANFVERTILFPSDYERHTKGSDAFNMDFWEDDSDIDEILNNYAERENSRIDYIKDNFRLCSGYVFNSLRDSLLCEILKMAQAGITLRKCDNCGRYFIFNPNQPAKYCQYSYDDKRLSCRQIGSQRKYKQNLHPIRECYNKARNRRFNQMPSKKSGLRTADIENKYKLWQIDNTEKMIEYIEKYDSESEPTIKNGILEEFRNYLDSTLNKE